MTATLPRRTTQRDVAEAMAVFFVMDEGIVRRGPGMDWATVQEQVTERWSARAWRNVLRSARRIATERLGY